MKESEEIIEIFDRMIGECFTVAQQQKYGFLDSVAAEQRINNHAYKYKSNLKRVLSEVERKLSI